MNEPASGAPLLAWYRVPEFWLILILLGAAVVGSFALLATAIRTADQHITVPNDVPRPSRIPPRDPASSPTDATRGDDGNSP